MIKKYPIFTLWYLQQFLVTTFLWFLTKYGHQSCANMYTKAVLPSLCSYIGNSKKSTQYLRPEALHIILWLSNGVLNIFSRFSAFFFFAFSALTFILCSKIFAAGPFLVDNGVTELQKKIGAFVRRVNKKSLIYPTTVSVNTHSQRSLSICIIRSSTYR